MSTTCFELYSLNTSPNFTRTVAIQQLSHAFRLSEQSIKRFKNYKLCSTLQSKNSATYLKTQNTIYKEIQKWNNSMKRIGLKPLKLWQVEVLIDHQIYKIDFKLMSLNDFFKSLPPNIQQV